MAHRRDGGREGLARLRGSGAAVRAHHADPRGVRPPRGLDRCPDRRSRPCDRNANRRRTACQTVDSPSMRYPLLIVLGLVFVVSVADPARAADPKRPNIVLIYADDL